MTDLTQFIPGVTRVICPGGIPGTVDKISARSNAHWPILVRRDDGTSRSYAATELTRLNVAVRNPMREPMP